MIVADATYIKCMVVILKAWYLVPLLYILLSLEKKKHGKEQYLARSSNNFGFSSILAAFGVKYKSFIFQGTINLIVVVKHVYPVQLVSIQGMWVLLDWVTIATFL